MQLSQGNGYKDRALLLVALSWCLRFLDRVLCPRAIACIREAASERGSALKIAWSHMNAAPANTHTQINAFGAPASLRTCSQAENYVRLYCIHVVCQGTCLGRSLGVTPYDNFERDFAHCPPLLKMLSNGRIAPFLNHSASLGTAFLIRITAFRVIRIHHSTTFRVPGPSIARRTMYEIHCKGQNEMRGL